MQFLKSLFFLAALSQVSALPTAGDDVDFQYQVMTVVADQSGEARCVYFQDIPAYPNASMYHFTSCSDFKTLAQNPMNQFRVDENGFVRPNSGNNSIDGFLNHFASEYYEDSLQQIQVPSENPTSAMKFSSTNNTLYSSVDNRCISTEYEYTSLYLATGGCSKVSFRPLSDF